MELIPIYKWWCCFVLRVFPPLSPLPFLLMTYSKCVYLMTVVDEEQLFTTYKTTFKGIFDQKCDCSGLTVISIINFLLLPNKHTGYHPGL